MDIKQPGRALPWRARMRTNGWCCAPKGSAGIGTNGDLPAVTVADYGPPSCVWRRARLYLPGHWTNSLDLTDKAARAVDTLKAVTTSIANTCSM